MTPTLWSVKDLARHIRRQESTACALVEESLRRIDELNPALNGFVAIDRQGAIKQADVLDYEASAGSYRGPLHGLPVAVKANMDVEGAVVSGCSKAFQGRVAAQDAVCIQRLREAGAVIVGITNMHELAYGGTGNVSLHGPAKNPRDERRIAGGSSSGSAVAVASGMVPLALGTDTGGSVRIPAAACGIVGFKPSYGVIDKTGVLPLSWTLDHIGPLTQDVVDAGISAAVLCGDAHQGAALLEQMTAMKPTGAVRNCRIGVCRIGDMGVDPSIHHAMSEALGALQDHGAVRQEFDLQYVRDAHVSWLNIMYAEATSYYAKDAICNYQDFSSTIRVQLEAGKSISAVSYLDAQRFRSFFQDYFFDLFKKYDLVCLPTLPIVAPLLGQEEVSINGKQVKTQDAMTFTNQLANMLGCPAISIPAGFDDAGLPIGMSLLMPYGRDLALLQLAAEFEWIFARMQR